METVSKPSFFLKLNNIIMLQKLKIVFAIIAIVNGICGIIIFASNGLTVNSLGLFFMAYVFRSWIDRIELKIIKYKVESWIYEQEFKKDVK